MNKCIPITAFASLLLMMAVGFISGQRSDPSTEDSDFAQHSGKREHHDSYPGAAASSELENSPRRQRDANARSSKSKNSTAYLGPNDIDRWVMQPETCWEQEGKEPVPENGASE